MANFIDHSAEVKAKLEGAIEAALEAMGNQAVSHAKQNITKAGRVDTGNLRDSMTHQVEMNEKAVHVGTNNKYAIYNEMGTGVYIGGGRQSPWAFQDANGNWHRTNGMPPVHFLKNAIQEHANEYMKIAESIIGEKMK